MRVWVAEGTKAVVVFLASGIPQGKFDVFPVDLYICNIVLKHGGDVDLVDHETVKLGERTRSEDTNLWECSFRENYQQAGLGEQADEAGTGQAARRAYTFPQAPSPTMTSFLLISAIVGGWSLSRCSCRRPPCIGGACHAVTS